MSKLASMSTHPSRLARMEDEMDVDTPPQDAGGGILLEDLAVNNDYALYGTDMRAQTYLDELSRRQRAKQIVVPTEDTRVRARLRELGEPITLFGEDKADRRARLRQVLLEFEEDAQMRSATGGSPRSATGEAITVDEEEEEFYTPGDEELYEARKYIAMYSLKRARLRHAQQVEDAKYPLSKLVRQARSLSDHLRDYALMGTQFVADRAISAVRISPDSQIIAAGSWTGSIRLLHVPTLEYLSGINSLRGHTDKIGGLAWHPGATKTQSLAAVNLVSGGGDYTVKLWSMESDTPIATLSGHEGRVCRVAFHPSGRYIGSASFDYTWRLWDAETQACLLTQEGHSKEVYCVAFQNDGALVASAGLDGIGRVWDLRSGRAIMVLDGHSREIYGVDFSSNGYHVATASGDATVKIWDIRKVRAAATIPAHKSLVSEVRFFTGQGEDIQGDIKQEPGALSLTGSYLATSGYDGCVNIWKADSWTMIKSLKGHSEKAMSMDIANNNLFIASGGWDRSVKLWANEQIGL
ncbi:WD40-repeat-containing domain protein [Limtongia smithiae]|uniref:WD40-repeat-containing domain protein n=1 Tax=Limtongia smithiae TaxID=1125753 RepID=UPI0034CDB4B3